MTSELAGPDPQFENAITRFLADRLGADEVRLTDLRRIAVGWSHETFLFDAHWRLDGAERRLGLCLRRDPGHTLLRHLSDLGQQFRVLQCLEPTPVPSPRPYWFEDDPAILGAPFLIMEKAPGICPSPWGRDGQRFYHDAAARGVLPASFTEALATLHNLDWEAAGLSFLGVPQPGTDAIHRELAKWRALIADTQHPPEPILTDLICWLEDNAPSVDRFVLVHGAYRTGNVLIDDDRVSAILDWELQTIADPMYDVAYVLSDLNRQGGDLLSDLVPRADFYRWYESATGIEIDEQRCDYYQLLYAMRSAAFWMSASDLYAAGHSSDLRLARTAWSVPVVLERAARDLGY